MSLFSNGRGCESTFYGWPLVWCEYQHIEDCTGLELDDEAPQPIGNALIEYKGCNAIIPVLWFLVAASLPSCLVGLFTHRSVNGVQSEMTPLIRACGTIFCASAFGLGATALELDTQRPHVFHITGTHLWSSGGRHWYAPVHLLDDAINDFRPKTVWFTMPDGTPVYNDPDPWLAETGVYKKTNARVTKWRLDFTEEAGSFSQPPWCGGWPTPESAWDRRQVGL